MLETIGWIGGTALAFCGLPQAYKSWKEGHSDGLAWGMLILLFIGALGSLIYVLPLWKIPLILNYVLNLVFVVIISYYKIRPRRGKKMYSKELDDAL